MRNKSKETKVSRVRVDQSFITIVNTLFACNITKLVQAYTKMANRYQVCNGPKWTCDRLKNYYTIGCRLSLRLDVTNISFCKSKGNIPIDLALFYPYLLSPNVNKRRAALTVLRLYTQIHMRASESTNTIETKGPDELQFQAYSAYFDQVCLKYKSFLNPQLEDEPMFTTSKAGPNGPAMLSADKDYFAIKKSGILDTIIELNAEIDKVTFRKFDREVQLADGFAPSHDEIRSRDSLMGLNRTKRKNRIYDSMECFNEWRMKENPNIYDNCKTSKLSFLSEGGCKTRVVAMGDFFTQDALKPIHKDLYRMLSKLKTDGTSSHNRISQVVKEKTLTNCVVWSFDLTAATDRFPIFIQEKVLSVMYGPSISRLWRKLMVDRDFYVSKSKRFVRYGAGQPMGLLSSWATFALTHHIIVETCALMVGKTTFKEYVVIGDDVTIFDDRVAMKYKEFLSDFNIEISEAKSLHSENKFLPCAEIAKRLFIKGQEVSPLPHDAVISATRNHMLFTNLIRLAMERDVITSISQWEPVQDILSKVYGNKRAKDVLAIISSPIQKLPIGITSDIWDDFDSDQITSKFDELKIQFIKKTATECYRKGLFEPFDMGILGDALNSGMDPNRLKHHPLMTVLNAYRDRCSSIYLGIMFDGIAASDIELIPFLVDPTLPQYVRRTHRIEKIRSTIILKTYKELLKSSESTLTT